MGIPVLERPRCDLVLLRKVVFAVETTLFEGPDPSVLTGWKREAQVPGSSLLV